MIYLLPLSLFSVDYQIAKRRSYSILEQEVLGAICSGVDSFEELNKIFFVHRRILLEALVTLVHAGWVSIGVGKDSSFAPTRNGRIAVECATDLRSKDVEDRTTTIVHDSISGQSARASELNFIEDEKLNSLDYEGVKLKGTQRTPRLGPGHVEDLVFSREGEWLTTIRGVRLRSKNRHWLPIEFNAQTNRFIETFPWYWRDRILPILYKRAAKDGLVRAQNGYSSFERNQQVADRLGTMEGDESQKMPGVFPISLQRSSFLTSNLDHEKYFRQALISAHSYLMVSSAFLSPFAIERYDDLIYSALKRGVDIDFLWGYSDGDGKGVELLKKIAFNSKKQNLDGKLNFNSTRTNSHSKITIFDTEGKYEASVGSYNWLSAVPSDAISKRLENISVVFDEPLLVAKLMRTVASLWRNEGYELKGLGGKWEKLAARIDEASALVDSEVGLSEPNGTAELILDSGHSEWLERVAITSTKRVTVISHKIGAAAQRRLSQFSNFSESENERLHKRFAYSESILDDQQVLEKLCDDFLDAGWRMVERSNIHSKFAIADDEICIGSYNFLSTDVYDSSKLGKEISLIICSKELADYFDGFIESELFDRHGASQ